MTIPKNQMIKKYILVKGKTKKDYAMSLKKEKNCTLRKSFLA